MWEYICNDLIIPVSDIILGLNVKKNLVDIRKFHSALIDNESQLRFNPANVRCVLRLRVLVPRGHKNRILNQPARP